MPSQRAAVLVDFDTLTSSDQNETTAPFRALSKAEITEHLYGVFLPKSSGKVSAAPWKATGGFSEAVY